MISIENTGRFGVGGERPDLILESDVCHSVINRETLEFGSQQACTSIVIMGENGEVGRLSWDDGQFAFSGDMAESAKIFFENVLKPLVDDYIHREG